MEPVRATARSRRAPIRRWPGRGILLAALLALVPAAAAATSPTITAPDSGSTLAPDATITFAWTAVAGADRYGFEFTGANRHFLNPGGGVPDAVNGVGGAGGGFLVTGTSLAIRIEPGAPPGAYQVRVIGVIGVSPGGQLVGTFSDAVTVRVPGPFWVPDTYDGRDPDLLAAFGDSITEGTLGDPPFGIAARPYPAVLTDRLRIQYPAAGVFSHPLFAGGDSLAVADVGGDRKDEILTGAGPGSIPLVAVFKHAPGAPGGVLLGASFLAFAAAFTGGLHLAAAPGVAAGPATLVAAPGAGGGGLLRVFALSSGGSPLGAPADFFAFSPEFLGGVAVGVAGNEVLAGAGPGGEARVRGFTTAGQPTGTSFVAFPAP